MSIGLAAFTGAVVLVLLRAADEGDAFKRMPWSAILMVCGLTNAGAVRGALSPALRRFSVQSFVPTNTS
jgi:hypothetical protein